MSENNFLSKMKTLDYAYMALATAVIAICSWIAIPLAVPITLQTFAIFTVVGLLGTKRGVISILVYILLGAVGLPVFANFNSGVGYIMGSTGGYLLGFIISALIVGGIISRFGRKTPVLICAMVLGLLVCYAFGTAWFMYVYAQNTGPVGLITVLSWCVFPFIIPDMVKILLAVTLIPRVYKFVK